MNQHAIKFRHAETAARTAATQTIQKQQYTSDSGIATRRSHTCKALHTLNPQ